MRDALTLIAGKKGEAVLSVAQIALAAKVSESTAKRALRQLELAGELEVIDRQHRNGGRVENRYQLPGRNPVVTGPPAEPPPPAITEQSVFYALTPTSRPFVLDEPGTATIVMPSYPGPGEQFELVPAPAKFDPLEGFDQWWAGYPNKLAKMAARKAWATARKAKTLPPLAELIAALEEWKRSHLWTKDNGESICHGATWINGKRWLEHPPPPAPARRRPAMDNERRSALAQVGTTWNTGEENP